MLFQEALLVGDGAPAWRMECVPCTSWVQAGRARSDAPDRKQLQAPEIGYPDCGVSR